MRKLELIQCRATTWMLPTISGYKERLVYLEVLPFPIYLQIIDVLTLNKICNGTNDLCWEDVVSLKDEPRQEKKIPSCRKPQFDSTLNEFFARTTRLLFLPSIDLTRPIGLKPSLLRIFWQYFTSAKNTFVHGELLADAKIVLAENSNF